MSYRKKPARTPKLAYADVDSPERLAQRNFGGGPSPLSDGATLAKAKKLLAAGRLCQDVAREIGYASPAAFSTAFLQYVGMRPSDYAKSQNAPPPKKREGRRVQKRKRKPKL